MNKSELTQQLAASMHLSVQEAASIVNTIIDMMTEALAKGESIEIRGFGSFVVKEYDTYTGRNPKTGEQITVQPKKLPFFKVGKDLREQVNRDKKEYFHFHIKALSMSALKNAPQRSLKYSCVIFTSPFFILDREEQNK